MKQDVTGRIAVCSWSLQPESPEALAERVLLTGIPRIQLALDPLYECPTTWGRSLPLLRSQGISVVSGMVGCAGEDYSTLESIRVTGGIAPDATWERNRKDLAAKARFAGELGLTYVSFHAGFLPHDPNDPAFNKIVHRLKEVAASFAAHGIVLMLETGQETAEDLARVLAAADCGNLRVNFDPANMILYAKGDPIQAVRTLATSIAQLHIKDARATTVRGTWGTEMPVGKGEVDWAAFCATLDDIAFEGNLVIERESGTDRIADIRAASHVLEQAFQSLRAGTPACS